MGALGGGISCSLACRWAWASSCLWWQQGCTGAHHCTSTAGPCECGSSLPSVRPASQAQRRAAAYTGAYTKLSRRRCQ